MRREWLEALLRMLGANRRQRFTFIDQEFKEFRDPKEKERLRQAVQVWLSFWRDVLLCAAGSDVPLTNLDREEQARSLGAKLALPAARARVSDLEQAIQRLDANANPRLLAEVLLLDWPRL